MIVQTKLLRPNSLVISVTVQTKTGFRAQLGFGTDATIWIAHNHNRDCACCIPLVHVVQHYLREKCRQNRTRFRLCSPLLDNKKQCDERNQKSSSGSRAKGSLF